MPTPSSALYFSAYANNYLGATLIIHVPNRKAMPNMETEDQQEDFTRVRMPNVKEGEMFGIADQLLGASKIRVMCEDGVSRMGRIPGKIKKRMWIREGDLVIVAIWDFQPDKCDIRFRYTRTQSMNLSKRGKIPADLDIF